MPVERKLPSVSGSRELPLFYRRPVPLTLDDYQDKGLAAQGSDYSFSATTAIVPLYTDEFPKAAECYPIVFTDDECPMPVAVLGLRECNLFVCGNGTWRTGCYVPAYVERYPFIAMVAGDGATYLAVDAASNHLVQLPRNRNDAVVTPLFEKNGEAAPATRAAAHRCEQLVARTRETRRFTSALVDAGALGSRIVHVRASGGSQIALRGFHVVDEAVLGSLEAGTMAEWERNGWKSLIDLHRMSAAKNWQVLVDLELRRTPLHA